LRLSFVVGVSSVVVELLYVVGFRYGWMLRLQIRQQRQSLLGVGYFSFPFFSLSDLFVNHCWCACSWVVLAAVYRLFAVLQQLHLDSWELASEIL